MLSLILAPLALPLGLVALAIVAHALARRRRLTTLMAAAATIALAGALALAERHVTQRLYDTQPDVATLRVAPRAVLAAAVGGLLFGLIAFGSAALVARRAVPPRMRSHVAIVGVVVGLALAGAAALAYAINPLDVIHAVAGE